MMTLLTCQCDSVMKKMCGFLFSEVQKTCEPAMNCSDVQIVQTICCTLIIIALIFFIGFIFWKSAEVCADIKERKFKKEKEQEECKRKIQMDMVNRYLHSLDKQGNAENYQEALKFVTELVVQDKSKIFSKETIEKIFKSGKNDALEENPAAGE